MKILQKCSFETKASKGKKKASIYTLPQTVDLREEGRKRRPSDFDGQGLLVAVEEDESHDKYSRKLRRFKFLKNAGFSIMRYFNNKLSEPILASCMRKVIFFLKYVSWDGNLQYQLNHLVKKMIKSQCYVISNISTLIG